MSAVPQIFAAMIAVMDEVGAIGKNRKNTQQNYQFRGIDDVLAELQPLLVKHKIICVPEVLEAEREMLDTKSGGRMASVRLKVKHTYTCATDGSSVCATTWGEAMDAGDKASNKAMSAALKYAHTESFSIPTYEVDRDTEESSPAAVAPRPAQSQQNQPAAAKPASADQMAKEKAWLLAAYETSRTEDDLVKLWRRVEAFKEGTPDRTELQEKFIARRRVLRASPAPAEDIPF